MWWQEEDTAPTGIRKLWLHCVGFLYRGPSAWLVQLNLAICCVAFSPLLLLGFAWALGAILGAGSPIVGLVFLFFALFSELSYTILVPMLFAACVMLASRRIPLKVRTLTAVIEFVGFGTFFWFLHWAKIGFGRCGLLGCP
jgi:hypothetical protein